MFNLKPDLSNKRIVHPTPDVEPLIQSSNDCLESPAHVRVDYMRD